MIRTLTLAALAAFVLGGCAAMNTLNNEVSTFGAWPAERKPASFVFERLPSQQARPERQQMLEDAALGALTGAGFAPATNAKEAEYLMQLGARVALDDPWFDPDPMFWRGGLRYGVGYGYGYGRGYGRWAHGPWGPGFGPGFGFGYGFGNSSNFERDVALLIRDRKTGELLYEARASNSGPSPTIDRLLPPMFRAALKGFPVTSPEPHTVTVPLSVAQ
ncbi:MAG: DUF4136 domain-containing protein [Bacteriovorax sp.]|nr:DUF4136 domain-containing protein [Rhizobacter sp.]